MNKDNRFDDILKQAEEMATEELGRSLDKYDIPVEFSPEHKQKMQAIFAEERRNLKFKKWSKAAKRAACIILAVFIISGAVVYTGEALNPGLIDKIRDKFSSNSMYGDVTNVKYNVDDVFLRFIPEGFTLKEYEAYYDGIELTYTNDDLYFTVTLFEAASNKKISLENGAEIEINAYKGIYSEDNSDISLVWSTKDFDFKLTSNISKEDTVNIAKNIAVILS